MAANLSAKAESINPCCALWRARCGRLEEKRNALREGVKILKAQIDSLQNEKQNLEKEHNEERAQADDERKEKEKESTLRLSLEQEVAALKLEISSFQQEGCCRSDVDEEVMLLKAKASEWQSEIDQLKQLLGEEKTKAELERKNVDLEKKKSATLERALKSEKTRADEAAKLAELGAKKAKEYQVQLDITKNELDAVRSDLSKEKSRYSDSKKKLDAENQKALCERGLVDKEKARTLQQKRVGEEEICNANNLLKLLEEERQKVDTLEKEMNALASSHDSADVNNARCDENSVTKNTLAQISEQEAEIMLLKQLLEGEKERADDGWKNAELLKKSSAELQVALESERSRANEKIELAYADSKRFEEYQVQLEMLRSELIEARSIISLEKSKCKDLMKELESEKENVVRDRRHIGEEKEKSVKLRYLLEENEKKVVEERCRANNLFKLLDEEKEKVDKLQKEMQVMLVKAAEASWAMNYGTVSAKTMSLEAGVQSYCLRVGDIDISPKDERKGSRRKGRVNTGSDEANELRKLAESSSKRAVEERVHADYLSHLLENSRTRITELENELEQLKLSSRLVGGNVRADADIMADYVKRYLLEDRLKFEKKRVKHAKEVAKLEKGRNYILQQELHQLKQDFVQMLHRMDFWDRFLCHGVDDPEKLGDPSDLQRSCWNRRLMSVKSLMHDHELVIPNPSVEGASDFLIPTGCCRHPENNVESLSGIKTKMDPLLGGSDREILSSSAINSKASFSDKKFVGSQERDAGSLTTSAVVVEGDSNPQPTISTSCAEGRKRKHIDNVAMVAENAGKYPLDKLYAHCQNRRRIIDGFESIKCMQSESRRLHEEMEEKLSRFQDLFNGLVNECIGEEKGLVLDTKCTSHSHRKGSRKRRKTSRQSERNTGALCGSDLQQHGDFEAASFQLNTGTVEKFSFCKAAVGDLLRSDEDRVMNFEHLVDGDYMKLLNLDNAVDEESFRMAMERPLSPILPEILMQNSRGGDMDLPECLVEESGNTVVLINKKDSDKCSSLDEFGTGNCCGKLCNYSRPSSGVLEKDEAPVVSSETVEGDGNGFCSLSNPRMPLVNQFCGSGVNMEALNMLISESRLESFGSVPGSANCAAPLFCLVFSPLNDSDSIARIFSATKTYVAHFHLFSETSWLGREILAALASNKQLMRRERICVLFSLILRNFCLLFSTKSTHFNYKEVADSLSTHMRSVLSDMEGRSLLAGLCDIGELVSLFENFVEWRRILVLGVEAPELHVVDTSFNIHLEDETVMLDSKVAPPHLLIVGSIILASICSAVEQTGAICDASINIIYLCKAEHSLMLLILHMFAYVCGHSYFSLSHCSLSMAVVKLLVTSIEGAAETEVTSVSNIQPWFHPAARCPFFEGFDSLDNVLSMLLEKTCDASYTHNLVLGTEFSNICCSDDIMSLMELISSIMGWAWTFNRIVQHLLKLLESCSLKSYSTIVVLLGHLGRIGLNARGNDDAGVGRIKSALSSALCRTSTMMSCPSLVVATMFALLGLSSGDYEETVQRLIELPANTGQPGYHDVMKRQLSSVFIEQKSLLSSLMTLTAFQYKDSPRRCT